MSSVCNVLVLYFSKFLLPYTLFRSLFVMVLPLPSKPESLQKAIRIFGKGMVSIILVDLQFSIIL